MSLIWGSTDIGILADTRALPCGYSLVAAGLTAPGFRETRERVYSQMRVRHNTPSIDTTAISYRLRVNGVDSLLVVSLAGDASDGSNLVDEVDVLPGDLVVVVAVKALEILSGALTVLVSVEVT